MLEGLHVDFDLATSTDEAIEYLVGRTYRFIITDFTRPDSAGNEDPNAGLALLEHLARACRPVIEYASLIDHRETKARKLGAREVTNRPSVLLDAVLALVTD